MLLSVSLISCILLVFCMLWATVRSLKIIQRVKKLIEEKLNLFEEVEDDDDGFVNDAILFEDLNPELRVERHRRMRLEAAAEVMGNAANAQAETARRRRQPFQYMYN